MQVSTVGQYRRVENDLARFREGQCLACEGESDEIRRILAFVHAHLFDRELNVALVKARCRIRDNNISTRFRRAMGFTIKYYIEHMRMKAAAELLCRRSIGVLDIALAIGYEHPQTFYHAFRRSFACTPSAYRVRSARLGVCSQDRS